MTGAAATLLVGVFAAIAVGSTFAWARLRVRVADDNAAALGELAAKRADQLDALGVAMTANENSLEADVADWRRRYRELAAKHGDTDAIADGSADDLGSVFGPDPRG